MNFSQLTIINPTHNIVSTHFTSRGCSNSELMNSASRICTRSEISVLHSSKLNLRSWWPTALWLNKIRAKVHRSRSALNVPTQPIIPTWMPDRTTNQRLPCPFNVEETLPPLNRLSNFRASNPAISQRNDSIPNVYLHPSGTTTGGNRSFFAWASSHSSNYTWHKPVAALQQ